MELFAQDAPKDLLERLVAPLDVLTESKIDEALVVPAPRIMDLGSEPLQDIFIEPDGNAHFPLRDRNYRSALPLAEIVLFAHLHHPSCWRRSLGIASRADMILILCPRQAERTTNRRPRKSVPNDGPGLLENSYRVREINVVFPSVGQRLAGKMYAHLYIVSIRVPGRGEELGPSRAAIPPVEDSLPQYAFLTVP